MRIEASVSQELSLTGASARSRRRLRTTFQRLGGSLSILIGMIGVGGFVISDLLLLVHALPIAVASWWIVLSLATYGIALGLGRLHEAVSYDDARAAVPAVEALRRSDYLGDDAV
jgi:hypothetical protein